MAGEGAKRIVGRTVQRFVFRLCVPWGRKADISSHSDTFELLEVPTGRHPARPALACPLLAPQPAGRTVSRPAAAPCAALYLAPTRAPRRPAPRALACLTTQRGGRSDKDKLLN